MSAVIDTLEQRLTAAMAAPEVGSHARGLALVVRFGTDAQTIDIVCDAGITSVTISADEADITIIAAEGEWERVMQPVPPPTYHSFSSIQLRNPLFDVSGEPLTIAQARGFLEAIFAQLTNSGGPTGELDLQVITGAYHPVSAPNGQRANIFTESSGAGTPLLCLHTAGADTRQFHGVMTDLALRTSWRMIGFDMPSHGRTMPPTGWVGESYAPRQPIWTGA